MIKREGSMANSSTTGDPSQRANKSKRKRAAFACKPCNSRRLKCDAVESGLPCTRCRSLGREADCELHQSRRGKYTRSNSKSSVSNTSPDVAQDLKSLAMMSDVAAASQPIVSISIPIQSFNEPPPFPDIQNDTMESVSRETTSNSANGEDTREGSPAFSTRPPSPKGPTDMIYANLFEEPNQPQSQTILYLGYATHNLSYILQRKGGFVSPFFHNSAVDGLSIRKPISHDELEFYRARGDYDLPSMHVQDELIRTYFGIVHPMYPVLDRVQFAKSYRNPNSPPSLLLLQAMFMCAAAHCPLEFLTEAGFNTRHEAKRTFYRRARNLFDADFEPNRIVMIQAAFLLQFWWESPLEQKDASYWHNVSVTLAQGSGMHRSTEGSGLSINNRRLWRRIWTCIQVRDGQQALAFGRPLLIQDADCDVEPMDELDFSEDGIDQIDMELFSRFTHQHILYSLNMMRLHRVAIPICMATAPSRAKDTSQDADKVLNDWHQMVEPEVQYDRNPNPDFWTRILHLHASYLAILLFRSERTSVEGHVTSPHAPQTLRVANFINLLFDELLAENELHMCPTHLIPSLFAAMAVHLSMAGLLEPMGRVDKIAKHRLRVSMMAMKELSAYWPVCTWIFHLFAKILKQKSGQVKKPLPDSNASPNVERTNEPLEDFDMSGLQPDDSFSYWAEIEEFTSSLAPLDGFDFSSVFDIGPEGLTSFTGEGDTPGQSNLFSHFLGS